MTGQSDTNRLRVLLVPKPWQFVLYIGIVLVLIETSCKIDACLSAQNVNLTHSAKSCNLHRPNRGNPITQAFIEHQYYAANVEQLHKQLVQISHETAHNEDPLNEQISMVSPPKLKVSSLIMYD